MEALASHAQKELRLAAEHTAAQVAAAGGCPSACLALRKDVRQGGDGSSILASAAACPKYHAARLAAAGGLNSDTVDWSDSGMPALGPTSPSHSHRDPIHMPIPFNPIASHSLFAALGPATPEEQHVNEDWWLADKGDVEDEEDEEPASELRDEDGADGGSDRAAPNESSERANVHGRRSSQVEPPPARAVRSAWVAPLTLLGVGALLAGLLAQQAHGEPRRRANRRGSAAGTAVSLLAMCTPTDAHNWMAWTRRRGGYASTVKPYPPGGQGLPAYKLNRGQPFNFGFVAGHGGPSYFVMVHSDDLDKLKELTGNVMEHYSGTRRPQRRSGTWRTASCAHRGASTICQRAEHPLGFTKGAACKKLQGTGRQGLRTTQTCR